MKKIVVKPFDVDVQAKLSEITAYHAGELSTKPLSELPPNIHFIEVNEEMAGYAVIWEFNKGKQLIHKAEQEYFSADEKYLHREFYMEIINAKPFVFIEALDILKDYEKKGYAAYFVKWLKETYPDKALYVYSLEKSQNFWYKQQFEPIGTTAWMRFV